MISYLQQNKALFGVALGMLLTGSCAYGEIYKYEDRAGNIYFTDRPMPGSGYEMTWRSGGKPGYQYPGSRRVDSSQMQRNRKRFTPLIKTVAQLNQLRPELLHAVIRAESSYDPKARSRKGAQGLMQLMPETARRYGVGDSYNPEQNISGGARYLRDLLAMFDNDLKLALAAYNAGENAVKRYGNRIPPFPETRNYVDKVLTFYRQNQRS